MKTEMTEEQRRRLRECKTPEDIEKFVAEEELDLSDDELEEIAGGWGSVFPKPVTPKG